MTKHILTLLTISVLSACASISPEEKYQSQVAEIEARERHARESANCESQGGVMVIRETRASRIGERDTRRAHCSR